MTMGLVVKIPLGEMERQSAETESDPATDIHTDVVARGWRRIAKKPVGHAKTAVAAEVAMQRSKEICQIL